MKKVLKLKLSERTVCDAVARRKLAKVETVAGDVGIAASTAVAVLGRLVAKGRLFRRELHAGVRGRPSYLYGVRLGGPLLAMHWDASQASAALFDDDAVILAMETIGVQGIKSQTQAATQANELIATLCTKAGRTRQSIASMVLSMNVVVTADGTLYSSVLPWADSNVARIFEQQTGLDTRLIAHPGLEAECQLLGESADSAVAYLHVADGVSGRFALANKPYSGHSQLAGELGHMTVEPNGKFCGCGRRGCLETLCNGPAIVGLMETAKRSKPPAWLKSALEKTSPAEVIDDLWIQWQRNDRVATAIMDKPLEHLAHAVSVLINLLDPQQIVVGGYVLQDRDRWLAELRERSQKYILFGTRRDTSLIFGKAQTQDLLRSIALSTQNLMAT